MQYNYLYKIGNISTKKEIQEGTLMTGNDGIEIALQERVKELNCLYGIARLAERNPDSMEDFLKGLVDFLPQCWRYADVACSRIVFHGEAFESRTFRWSEWRQSAQIRVGDEIAGDVTIGYLEERPAADEGPFLREERALLEDVARRVGEIAIRIMAQQELREHNRQLQEANAALRVILSNIEDEKKRMHENMRLNIDKVIMPILHTLAPAVAKHRRKYLDLLKTSLEEIAAPFIGRLMNHFHSLTPTEVDICNLIRNGLRTKEIAGLRGVSAATVSRHREHIRRKLKITNRQINLTTYLQSLGMPDPR